jgi:hypothetical protein
MKELIKGYHLGHENVKTIFCNKIAKSGHKAFSEFKGF